MSRELATDLTLALAEVRAILIFAAAQFLDLGTTILGFRVGLGSESNPIMAGLVSHSVELSLALKLLIATAVMLIVLRFISPARRWRVLLVMSGIALVAPLVNSLQLLAIR